jgi:oligopeptide transport system ATP-binding protein
MSLVAEPEAVEGQAAGDRPLLAVRGLVKSFPLKGRRRAVVRAVDGVSFEVAANEILGIVGESGCGKSTLGKAIAGIHDSDEGEILFEGRSTAEGGRTASRAVRRRLQYVWQDPGASLDPRWTIGRSLDEPLSVHTDLSRRERRQAVESIIREVGLRPEHLALYPHELSGGQQRRVGLARILTLRPSLVILDEPTSGLDVSVQATILKLFRQLWRDFRLTYLFISHDLGVVRMMCTRVAVMYLGRVVEIGPTDRVFARPEHPYTRTLLAAVPTPGGPRVIEAAWLEGEPPDLADLPSGCRFRTRCPLAAPVCAEQDPPLLPTVEGTEAACHFARRTE